MITKTMLFFFFEFKVLLYNFMYILIIEILKYESTMISKLFYFLWDFSLIIRIKRNVLEERNRYILLHPVSVKNKVYILCFSKETGFFPV